MLRKGKGPVATIRPSSLAWPNAGSGCTATGPATAQGGGACALWKSNDAVRYYFSRLGLCTKHLEKSYLGNGAVPDMFARGDVMHRRQRQLHRSR